MFCGISTGPVLLSIISIAIVAHRVASSSGKHLQHCIAFVTSAMMSDGYTYEEADMQCQIDWQARQAKLIDGNAKLIDAIEAAIKRQKDAHAASREGMPATL